MAEIEGRVRHLAALLRQELRGLPGVTLHDLGREPCGIVTFTCAGKEAGEVEAALRAEGINVSVSEPASTRLDTDRRQLPELVRASPHYFNSEDEIARFVEVLR